MSYLVTSDGLGTFTALQYSTDNFDDAYSELDFIRGEGSPAILVEDLGELDVLGIDPSTVIIAEL